MPKPIRVLKPDDPHTQRIARFAKAMALMDGTRDCMAIAREVKMTRLTIYALAAALHAEGVCHVAGWATDRRGAWTLRLYKLGAGPDADPPSRTDTREAKRAFRREQQTLPRPPFPASPWRNV